MLQIISASDLFVCFKTGSHYVTLAALELIMWTWLALNSEIHLSLIPKYRVKVYTTMPSLLPRTSTRHQVQEAGAYFPEVFTSGD